MRQLMLILVLLVPYIVQGQSLGCLEDHQAPCSDSLMTEWSQQEAWADSVDRARAAGCKATNDAILEEHKGKRIECSPSQHLVMQYPGSCWMTCYIVDGEHIDLWHYVPLARCDIYCGGKHWRVPR